MVPAPDVQHFGVSAVSCMTCALVSLGQILSPARARNAISPRVANENAQGKTKDQNGIDHPVKEHVAHPFAAMRRRATSCPVNASIDREERFMRG